MSTDRSAEEIFYEDVGKVFFASVTSYPLFFMFKNLDPNYPYRIADMTFDNPRKTKAQNLRDGLNAITPARKAAMEELKQYEGFDYGYYRGWLASAITSGEVPFFICNPPTGGHGLILSKLAWHEAYVYLERIIHKELGTSRPVRGTIII